jgi:hypothetical protein
MWSLQRQIILLLTAMTFLGSFAVAREKKKPVVDRTKAASMTELTKLGNTPVQPLNKWLFRPVVFTVDQITPSTQRPGTLVRMTPFSNLRYDTSPSNPEHRCYDFRKPLTTRYTFLFNFLSNQQYNAGIVALK